MTKRVYIHQEFRLALEILSEIPDQLRELHQILIPSDLRHTPRVKRVERGMTSGALVIPVLEEFANQDDDDHGHDKAEN